MSSTRVCDGCNQPIPASAKLAVTRATPRAAALLRGEQFSSTATEDMELTLCLRCRIRLAELAR